MSDNSSTDRTPSAPDASADNAGSGGNSSPNSQGVLQNKIELLLAATRAVTIICTFLYIVPIFGRSVQMSAYQKALLANGATSALRLHQRIPNFRLNMEFFNMLFLEDSAHYLLYSILFVFSRQITMVLLPIFLFALLHLASFLLRALNESDRQADLYHRILRFVEQYKIYIFKLIALSEITLAPLVLFSSIGDFSKLFLLFPYYRFLVFRYISRRNPYNRQMFTELKNTTIQLVSQPQCPQIVRTAAYKGISLVSSLAPAHDHTN